MRTLWQDVRFGLRTLRRTPGLTLVMVLTLALGIGASTAIFSMVSGVLLKPLPYEQGNELFRLTHSAPLAEIEDAGVSVQEMGDYLAQNRTLADLVEYHSLWFNLLDRGEPERVQAGVVSWNFFEVLGVRPMLGRTFTADENHVGAAPVLVLGYDFWQSHFGGDPNVVGRTVEMNDQIHTVVGVLPSLPQYPDENDVWMPWYACPFRSGPGWIENRPARALTVLGRVREGVDLESAQRDVAAIGERMVAEHAEAYPQGSGFRTSLIPLKEELTRDAREPFLFLLGMAGLLLLIACANVANLSLARMARREQELAVRSALGAGRGRLTRQLLTESILLALGGGALGVLLAMGLHRVLVVFSARLSPRSAEVEIDGAILLFALGISVATGLVVGVSPALFMSRDSAAALREGGGRMSSGRGRSRLRGALVATQVAVTCVLLVGAGLMIRSFVNLLRVEPGFQVERVLTAQIDLDWSTYANPETRRTFWTALLERVESLPGVQAAGLANNFPLNGGVFSNPVRVEGEAVEDADLIPPTDVGVVSAGYFDALGIPLLGGRRFGTMDHPDSPPVAMVSRAMARNRWGDRSPLGQRISFNGERWLTVVGVVGDVKVEELSGEFEDQVYLPASQGAPLTARVVLRTRSDPRLLGRQVVDAVQALDPRQPVAFIRTMEEVRSEAVAPQRLAAVLLGVFAAVALAISVAGILGVVAFSVGQRAREIGIRMALGARAERVRWMVVRQGMKVVWLGLALGLGAALLSGRIVAGLLFQVRPTDPLTLGVVVAVLAAAGALASYLPARRATDISPQIALRQE